MSDLIIKPSGTSANFKVQNPSGTDKIVMNSSGTITTGTLGSGVTFPTGMIIQMAFCTDDTQEHWTQARTALPITNLFVNITPTSASNTMIVIGTMWLGKANDQAAGVARRLTSASFNDSDTRITPIRDESTYGTAPSEGGYIRPGTQWSSDNSQINDNYAIAAFPLFGIDSVYDTTDEITYHAFTESETSGGETFTYNHITDTSYPNSGRAVSNLYVYEVSGTITPQVHTGTPRG